MVLQPMYSALTQFDPSVCTLSTWIEQFEEFCVANNILEEPTDEQGVVLPAHNQRRSLFLAYLGPRPLEMVRMQCLPDRPRSKTIEELTRILADRYEPVGLQATNRFTFSQRNQGDNETAMAYVAAIQELASRCNFGAFLEHALLDRLIAGIRNNDTRRKLLAMADLNYARARETVLQDECVRNQAQALANASVNRVVHHRQKSSKPASFGPCHRCGERHNIKTCKFAKADCHFCKKVGHIQKVCRLYLAQQKKGHKPNNSGPTNNKKRFPKRFHKVDAEGEAETSENEASSHEEDNLDQQVQHLLNLGN